MRTKCGPCYKDWLPCYITALSVFIRVTPAQYPAGDGETKEPEDSETKKPTECQVQAGRLGVRRQPEGDDLDSEKRHPGNYRDCINFGSGSNKPEPV